MIKLSSGTRFSPHSKATQVLLLASVEAGLVAWESDGHKVDFFLYPSEVAAAKVVHIRDLIRGWLIHCWPGSTNCRGIVALTDGDTSVLDRARQSLVDDRG